MKYLILFFFLAFSISGKTQGQTNRFPDNVEITLKDGETKVLPNEKGGLTINVSPKDLLKFKARGSG